jgi:phosphoribosylaminoimidazolecarboxamide formyltransferase/IMP cyclohydrolase
MGGWLVQDRDRVTEAQERWPGHDAARVVTRRAPTRQEWQALRFAWRVCAHVKSNTVIFTSADVTVAVGAGQMSRVDAVKTAVMKAGDRLKETVAASDAFFPFRDGPTVLIDAGVKCIVQPGGSKRDEETIELCAARDITLLLTGQRHFRH